MIITDANKWWIIFTFCYQHLNIECFWSKSQNARTLGFIISETQQIDCSNYIVRRCWKWLDNWSILLNFMVAKAVMSWIKVLNIKCFLLRWEHWCQSISILWTSFDISFTIFPSNNIYCKQNQISLECVSCIIRNIPFK